MKKNQQNPFKALRKFSLIVSLCAFIISSAIAQTPRWVTVPGLGNNMTATSMVVLNGTELHSTMIEIGAFYGTECRGSAFLTDTWFSLTNHYVGYLTIYSDDPVPITFKVYNHATGIEYEADNDPLMFVNDAIHGTGFAPYIISVTAPPPPMTWIPDVDHSSNMTMTAIVLIDGTEIRSDMIEIGAFYGTECRGSVLLEHQIISDVLDRYLGFLVIYSDDPFPITFKVYDHLTGIVYNATNPPLIYEADAHYGDGINPFIIHISTTPVTNYTITATAGDNGTISPAGAINVTANGTQAFIITPDACHEIDELRIDGALTAPDSVVSGIGYYTFKNVMSNRTIHVVFKDALTVPVFNKLQTKYCEGADIPALPTTSTNGITGAWSPAINNMDTTEYTFTPDPGQCTSATPVTLTIKITPKVTPTFSITTTEYCEGADIPALPTESDNGIPGTWSPVIDNEATTEYTFTPEAGLCATTATVTINITPKVTPTFSITPTEYCEGADIPALPTTSTNGITGTWSPDIDNEETTEYTFTPATGECATTTTVTITISTEITPTFSITPTEYCEGADIPALPTTSTNGITGTWSPDIDNEETTEYTFTPTEGQCATTTTVTINITPKVTPTFSITPTEYCEGADIPALPTTSTNGITGTWSPDIDNEETTEYTFTPATSECATTATVTITISTEITPTFSITTTTYCEGAEIPALPITSTNGITGTWSPDIDNEETTEYTFTPEAGQCATTATVTINITPKVTPTFSITTTTYCEGATIPALPTTSENGITGTWSPAINNEATTEYTFTPAPGQCVSATPVTVTITINSKVTPTFSITTTTYCEGTTIPALPTESDNGISGTWSPAINNEATTEYTFAPDAGECATTATVTINITPKETPTFSITTTTYCEGATIPALPTTSENGITGTWSPTINNEATTEYTFTPTAGLCATTATVTINITSKVTPTFSITPTEYCEGADIPALPTTSTNEITGTWSPAINNEATTEYTFTPAPGQCVSATPVTVTITINAKETPIFAGVITNYDEGDDIPDLPLVSDNGITGTWEPEINNMETTTYIFTPNVGECAFTANVTITVRPPNFVIIATAGTHGNIDPRGRIEVEPGTDKTFTFLPNTDYMIDKVYVDGVDVTASIIGNSYTFEDINDNHTIVVIFKSTAPSICPMQVYDPVNNIIYAVVELEGLCWTENLRGTLYQHGGAIPFAKPYLYFGVPVDPEIFGLLYTWYSATGVLEEFTLETICNMQGICPNGWRIPTQSEWRLLQVYSAEQLRSTELWLDPLGNGNGETGFNAIPAGWYNGTINRYQDLYGFAGWWASDAPFGTNAYSFYLTYYCNDLMLKINKKIDAMSVRCVMD